MVRIKDGLYHKQLMQIFQENYLIYADIYLGNDIIFINYIII